MKENHAVSLAMIDTLREGGPMRIHDTRTAIVLALVFALCCAAAAESPVAGANAGPVEERDRAAIARIEAPRLTEAEAAPAADVPSTRLGRLPLAES